MAATDSGSAAGGRLYRGLWPEQRKQQRRERLLAAALELFGTHGYQATTISALCRSAGVTTVHFYELFSSREELLGVLVEDLVEGTRNAVHEALNQAPEERQARTRAGVSAFMHGMLDDPRVGRVQCIESVGISDEFAEKRAEVLAQYTRLLELEAVRMAAHEGTVPTPHHYIAVALVGATAEAVVNWLADENPPPIDDLAEELTEMFVVVGRTFVATGDHGSGSGTRRL